MANRTLSLTRAFTVALVLALTFILGTTIASAGSRNDPVPGGDTIVSGCVIRFSDPDGSPSIYANGSHANAGCLDVRVNPRNGRLQVFQAVDDPARYPIIGAMIQADETLSARGIIAGASGGTGDTEISFYSTRLDRQLDLRRRADRMELQGEFSNAWLLWVHAPVGGTR